MLPVLAGLTVYWLISISSKQFNLSYFHFSQGAYVVFDMMAYEKQRTEDLIDNMVYFGGTTNIAEALEVARNDLLPNTRSGSIKILIMLTDGKSLACR